MATYTTLNAIRVHSPCVDGWAELLRHLGKTQADDEPLALTTILDSNGLDDALWCLRACEGIDREARLYAVWCARQVQHLMTDPRSLAALDVAERHANGEATDANLAAARAEALAAAWSAAETEAGATAETEAQSAARSAARSAAWTAAKTEAGATARSAAWTAAETAAWAAALAEARSEAWAAAGAEARSEAWAEAWAAAWTATETEARAAQTAKFRQFFG
jgi:hypothetical protein